nr:MAG TPA: hypothetical protein [Caudoviricetes sp.]
MIDKAERETGNENQAASSDPRQDVISASPDCSCEISVPLPTGYRVTLRGFGKVAAASPKTPTNRENTNERRNPDRQRIRRHDRIPKQLRPVRSLLRVPRRSRTHRRGRRSHNRAPRT